ncbi:MAG: AarF/UbiB family protein [Minicystis sp.]
MNSDDRSARERARLMDVERAVPTSRLSRLFRVGTAASALGAATLGGRLRGRGAGLGAADLADLTRLVERLGELKGVAMKAGQILGYIDPTLPPELRGMLSLLQTAAPASPFSAIEAALREAFGQRADELLAGLERAPIAVASIGQVHRAHLGGGSVAVKVRHPGIVEALRADFATAALGSIFARALMPGAGQSVQSFIDEARSAMLEETDFALEADRQRRFGAWFADHPVIRVPAVERAWCADAVLTTRWSAGRSLDRLLAEDPPQHTRDRLGVALFELYVGTLYRRGAFHADPHPGNYAFDSEGRVIVYDFGCVRSFDRSAVRALAALVAAVRRDEPAAMEEAFASFGASLPRDREGSAHVLALLRGFFAPLLQPGARRIEAGAGFEAQHLMRDKRALMQLGLPGRLLFLFRIRFGLYAVLARLGASADWSALESGWAAEALGRGGDSLPAIA